MSDPAEPATIAITACKAQFLRLADEVARSGRPLIVTRRGRPLIRIEAAAPPRHVTLKGTVTQLVDDDEFIRPVLGEWEADPWWNGVG